MSWTNLCEWYVGLPIRWPRHSSCKSCFVWDVGPTGQHIYAQSNSHCPFSAFPSLLLSLSLSFSNDSMSPSRMFSLLHLILSSSPHFSLPHLSLPALDKISQLNKFWTVWTPMYYIQDSLCFDQGCYQPIRWTHVLHSAWSVLSISGT